MTYEEFRLLIHHHFNLEEIRTICFDLSIDYDDFGGEGKQAKIRELITLCRRTKKIPALLKSLKIQREKVNWPSVEEIFGIADGKGRLLNYSAPPKSADPQENSFESSRKILFRQRVRFSFRGEFLPDVEAHRAYIIRVISALLGIVPDSIEVQKVNNKTPNTIIYDLILPNEASATIRKLLKDNALSLHKLQIEKASLQTTPNEFEEWVIRDGAFRYSHTNSFHPSNSLAIGLGGYGINALRFIRKKNDVPSSVFDLDTIQLLGVDVERFRDALPPALHYNEYADIGGFFLPKPHLLEHLENIPHIASWLDFPQGDFFSPIRHNTMRTGANSLRVLGRIAFFYNFNRYSDQLRMQLSKLKTTLPIKIFIISSLVGGTGSGIFLDVAQHIRNEVGADQEIIGIFMMPELFSQLFAISDYMKVKMLATAFASLKELFYFQKPGRYKMQFSSEEQPIVSNHLLFDEIYLIGMRDSGGKVMSLVEAQNLIADFIINNVEQSNNSNLKVSYLDSSRREIQEMYEAYSTPKMISVPLHGRYSWRHSLPDNIWDEMQSVKILH